MVRQYKTIVKNDKFSTIVSGTTIRGMDRPADESAYYFDRLKNLRFNPIQNELWIKQINSQIKKNLKLLNYFLLKYYVSLISFKRNKSSTRYYFLLLIE